MIGLIVTPTLSRLQRCVMPINPQILLSRDRTSELTNSVSLFRLPSPIERQITSTQRSILHNVNSSILLIVLMLKRNICLPVRLNYVLNSLALYRLTQVGKKKPSLALRFLVLRSIGSIIMRIVRKATSANPGINARITMTIG